MCPIDQRPICRYFESPPGLQFLHCLENSVIGGESLFVDAYKAVEILKAKHPKDFDILTRIPVTFHYNNDGHHLQYRRTTLVKDDLNEWCQVFYAPPFQGPLDIDEKDVAPFYDAFRKFEDTLKDESLVYTTLLREGDCVIFANRRVLHGRAEFNAESGKRHLKGTYVDWDDFRDKLRTVGIK